MVAVCLVSLLWPLIPVSHGSQHFKLLQYIFLLGRLQCSPWVSQLKLPIGIGFPIVVLWTRDSSYHVVQLMVQFLRPSKHLIICWFQHVSSTCLSMCSSMNLGRGLFYTVGSLVLRLQKEGALSVICAISKCLAVLLSSMLLFGKGFVSFQALKLLVYAQSLQFNGCWVLEERVPL